MLRLTDVPRPNNVFWVSEPGFIRVVQPEPRREVLLAGERAQLWELIDAEEYSVKDLVALMAAEGIQETRTLELLNRLLTLDLITVQNYLWKEDKSS